MVERRDPGGGCPPGKIPVPVYQANNDGAVARCYPYHCSYQSGGGGVPWAARGSWMLDTRFWRLETRCWMLDAPCSILAADEVDQNVGRISSDLVGFTRMACPQMEAFVDP